MRDLTIAILMLWGLGMVAAICHLRKRAVLGHAVMVLVLCGFTRTAIVHRAAPVKAPFFQINEQLAAHRETVDSAPLTVGPLAVYGSTIKDFYHLPSCRYVAAISHPAMWGSPAEAELAGKQPCKHCHPAIRLTSQESAE